MKLIGRILSVLVGLVLAVVFAMWFLSEQRLGKDHTADVSVNSSGIMVTSDSASVARGEYLAHSLLVCTECHGPDLGGQMFVDSGAMGRIPAANLTKGKGGVGSSYSVEDWDRAIRHGVGRDGRGLFVMPSEAYVYLTDGEMSDLLSYVASIPPVDREFAPRSFGPIGRMLAATGQPLFPVDRTEHDTSRPSTAPVIPGVERGKHLAKVSGCEACHGANLAGGKVAGADPSWPPAGNLTPHAEGLARYDLASFSKAVQTGAKVDGSQIDPAVMPWKSYSGLRDEELGSLWAYMNSLPATETPK